MGTAEMLQLERIDERRWRAPHVAVPGAPGNVFGGQLLAQLVAAAGEELDHPLTSLDAVFSRAARLDEPLYIDVEPLHTGRSVASVRLRLHQGGAGPASVEALALGLAPQEIPVAHNAPMPPVGTPDDAQPGSWGPLAVETRIVGAADLSEAAVGPPELCVWIRDHDGDDDPAARKAVLAYASEPWFVGAALRPHPGWSQSQSFQRFAPAMVSQSLRFHAHESLGGWWLCAMSSPSFAGGRIFGRGDVFADDGRLLASITTENLLRPLATPPTD